MDLLTVFGWVVWLVGLFLLAAGLAAAFILWGFAGLPATALALAPFAALMDDIFINDLIN